MPKLKNRQSDPVKALVEREERFEKALKHLKAGDYTSVAAAAAAFNLPKSSLGHRLTGRQNRRKAHEGDQVLSPAAEKAVVRWILKLDDCGFPPRLDRLWQAVENLAVAEREALRARYKAEGRKNIVHDHIGKNWITQFLNRHPLLASKFAVRMDRQRVYANNPVTIVDHFRKLGKIVRDEDIDADAITNVDEKGMIMGYSAKTKVITQRGKKNPFVKQHGAREMITLVEAVTASGYVFPTFMITKGKVHTYGSFGNLKEEDADTRFAKSPKGWTDEELGYYWLTEVYEPNSRKLITPGQKRLLILDGHVSHVNYKFCEYCQRHNIILYCLPAHSTHLLQPLDVGLFGPLQKAYGKAVEDFYLTTNMGIGHSQFLPLYKKARTEAYTKANIQKAFQTTGIWPFNPRAVKIPGAERTQAVITQQRNNSFPLDNTPYTKCQLRALKHRTLEFVKTACPGELSDLVVKYHNAIEFHESVATLAQNDNDRLRQQLKVAKHTKKDQRAVAKGQARVITGEMVMAEMREMDAKVAAKEAKAAVKATAKKNRATTSKGPTQRRRQPTAAQLPSPVDRDTSLLSAADGPAPIQGTPRQRTLGLKLHRTTTAADTTPDGQPPPSMRVQVLRFASLAPGRGGSHSNIITSSLPEESVAGSPTPSILPTATPKRVRVRSKASGGVPRSLPRARLLAPTQMDISSASEPETDWDEDSFSSESEAGTAATPCPPPPPATQRLRHRAALRPEPELRLNTPQAPNRRLPDRPLGMSLRSRQPRGSGNPG